MYLNFCWRQLTQAVFAGPVLDHLLESLRLAFLFLLLVVLQKLEEGPGLLLFGQVLEGALDGALVVVVAVEVAVVAGMKVGTSEAAVVSEIFILKRYSLWQSLPRKRP
jgi:hypothetical protein